MFLLYQDKIEVPGESPESLFLRPVSLFKSLFCSGPFSIQVHDQVQNYISSRTPFCYPYSLFCSVPFRSDFPIQVQNQVPPELNLFQNTPFLLSLFSVLFCSVPF